MDGFKTASVRLKEEQMAALNQMLASKGHGTLSSYVHELIAKPQDTATLSHIETLLSKLLDEVKAISQTLSTTPARIVNNEPCGQTLSVKPLIDAQASLKGPQWSHHKRLIVDSLSYASDKR